MFKRATTDEVIASLDDCYSIDEITHYRNSEVGGAEWIIRAYLDTVTDELRFVMFTSHVRRITDGGTDAQLAGIAEFTDISAVKDWLHAAEDGKAEVAYESYQTRKGYGYASHAFGGYTEDSEGRITFNKPEGWWTYTITPGKLDWSELESTNTDDWSPLA
jgi:hypothetical protein